VIDAVLLSHSFFSNFGLAIIIVKHITLKYRLQGRYFDIEVVMNKIDISYPRDALLCLLYNCPQNMYEQEPFPMP
jgi:hypothetical protein